MDFIFSLNSLQLGKKTLKKVSMKQIKLKETKANQTKQTSKQKKNPFKLWNNVWRTLRYTQKEQKMLLQKMQESFCISKRYSEACTFGNFQCFPATSHGDASWKLPNWT